MVLVSYPERVIRWVNLKNDMNRTSQAFYVFVRLYEAVNRSEGGIDWFVNCV